MKPFSFWIFNTDRLVLPSLDEEGDDVVFGVGQGVEDDDELWTDFET